VKLVYDGDGNRVQETVVGTTTNYLVADQNLTGYAQMLDELQIGTVTRTSVTQFLNGNQLVTTYAYDEIGNRITQTDANGHATSFAYDKLGRRSSRTLPAGGASETYQYDAAGNLKSKTDFNGRTTTYAYDGVNRLLSKTADVFFSTGACAGGACGATQVSYTYSATSRRLSMTDASGTTSYTYDNRDRLLTKAAPAGTLTYTYDAAGNTLSLNSSNAGGASMTYGYDVLNRLSSVTDPSGVTSYSYDAVGNLSGYTYPNGVATSYTYDTLNRLTNMQSLCGTGTPACAPGTAIASYAYSLGAAGNRLSVAELSGRTVNYGYDDLYRLTSETISGAASQNGNISYTYDSVGNRTQRNSTVPAVPATGLLNYDANDRTSTDFYDAGGNLLSSGAGANVYDFENRLVQAGGVKLVYDGDGNRVGETVAGTTTNYLVADQNLTGYAQVLDELQGGSVSRTYSYGLSLISQRLTANGQRLSFYGFDGHGSVRFLTDPSGSITDTYDYDAFGNLISQTGTTSNNYLFAGEQFDPALGIYYNRARYYDQRIGRFWSMDRYEGHLQDPTTLHRYLYANADPVNLSDPSGLLTDYSPYGYVIEPRIQVQYVIDYGSNNLRLGTPTGLGANPLLKPDIFDSTRRIWMDIKPLSFAGIADAVATWDLYNTNFSPLGYLPDRSWQPTYQNPIGYDGKLFFVKNVQGILFYTVDADNRRLRNLNTFADARQLLRALEQTSVIGRFYAGASIFGVGAGAAIGALVNGANAAGLTEIEQDVGIAVLEDAA
jgi:RHS repeat-associated protein